MEKIASLQKTILKNETTLAGKKKLLRQYFSKRRNELYEKSFVSLWGPSFFHQFLEIFSSVLNLSHVKIALYQEIKSEIAISEFGNVNSIFPIIKNDLIYWTPQTSEIEFNKFKIKEYKNSKIKSLDEIPEDLLMIVPCLSASLQGDRLGYGGGFYDRTLSQTKKKNLITICFCPNELLIDQLPREIHDYLIDIIITEDKIILTKDNFDYLLKRLRNVNSRAAKA